MGQARKYQVGIMLKVHGHYRYFVLQDVDPDREYLGDTLIPDRGSRVVRGQNITYLARVYYDQACLMNQQHNIGVMNQLNFKHGEKVREIAEYTIHTQKLWDTRERGVYETLWGLLSQGNCYEIVPFESKHPNIDIWMECHKVITIDMSTFILKASDLSKVNVKAIIR